MRIVIGQTGAPTAVVNRSVAGFLDRAAGAEVLVARGGPDALVRSALDPLPPGGLPADEVERGGSWLGGGRRAMTPDDVDAVVTGLAGRGVDGLCLVGGNGTMALLDAVARRAAERGVPLRTVGVPKTIDNDLDGVDHAPGFASAARFVSTATQDIARDHRAMVSIEPVRIVETMGRATGWLALAATLPVPGDDEHVVHRVHLPELGFDVEEFLADVAGLVRRRGRALIVVSEGVAAELTALPIHAANHTTLLVGGVARRLAELVTSELGLPARGEVLGVAQRCSSHLVSAVDAREAVDVGRVAARTLLDRTAPTRVMVGVQRLPGPGYRAHHPLVPLAGVAARVRGVPERWRRRDPARLGDFHTWLAPLVTTPTAACTAATAREAS
ncbi:6-phosphofructokinase [Pseudonocardia adelaidensis]|uniref:6-phosphofructokinase n=1 Tax=Pseudonocardia adelaidensis TaxID=648754 RepID=A0ABP9P5C1_9PSEU